MKKKQSSRYTIISSFGEPQKRLRVNNPEGEGKFRNNRVQRARERAPAVISSGVSRSLRLISFPIACNFITRAQRLRIVCRMIANNWDQLVSVDFSRKIFHYTVITVIYIFRRFFEKCAPFQKLNINGSFVSVGRESFSRNWSARYFFLIQLEERKPAYYAFSITNLSARVTQSPHFIITLSSA